MFVTRFNSLSVWLPYILVVHMLCLPTSEYYPYMGT